MALEEEELKRIEVLEYTVQKLMDWTTVLDAYTTNMTYELLDASGQHPELFPHFYSREECIRQIIEEGKSLARFGDGEFMQILGEDRYRFQEYDARLGARLKEVLEEKDNRLLIGIPNHYGAMFSFNLSAIASIRMYLGGEKIRERLMGLLDLSRTYCDAYLTRPYVLYNDCFTEAPKKRFQELKKIWQDRDLMIVEGSQSRIGVGNDLFENARSIRRIETLPINSFQKYPEIFKSAKALGKKEDLFLIALGPTAGVLAYDLMKEGYQAIDIGHVDLEYEWFLAGKGKRVPVPQKYNNEVQGGHLVQDCNDPLYISQVIDCIF